MPPTNPLLLALAVLPAVALAAELPRKAVAATRAAWIGLAYRFSEK